MISKQPSQLKLISFSVAMALASGHLYAQSNDATPNQNETQQLETIQVKGKRNQKRQNEVTGLGKIAKTTDDINKELILNIRDLTRYDPGISVVEQGRGASSGYAMRGVDKNRVAMLVDGLNQVQSYLTLDSDANGGAINEIEYENIKTIELSKGSSSAEYGNGALGGAVGFRTKEANDIIKTGKNWGLDSKTAYSSKNNQFTQSIAAAGKLGNFESLAIFTHRKGEETKIHSDAEDVSHTYRPLEGYFDEYNITSPNVTSGTRSRTYYIVSNDCPSLDASCRRAFAEINNDKQKPRPNLSAEEQVQAEKMPYPTRTASAKEYTGPDRISPNPMDYQSQSFFWKGGYRFNQNHYFGGVLEHTKQQYDIRDMTERAYYTREALCSSPSNCKTLGQNGLSDLTGLSVGNGGITNSDNPLDGLVYDAGNQYRGARYTRAKFFDERHHKNRLGLIYQYHNPEKNTWADQFTLRFDRQDLRLNSTIHRTACSDYPNAEKCRASLDKPWSNYSTERNRYQEKLNLAQINWEKEFRLGSMLHRVSINTGTGTTRSTMQHGDIYFEYTSPPAYIHKSGNGSYDNPHIYERENKNPVLVQRNACNNQRGDILDCTPRIIKSKQHFFALRNHIAFGNYADLGLGVRYDYHRFRSSDVWTQEGTYKNWSWNAGLSIKPSQYFTLSYRVSNGFRVPAFYELYGVRVGAAGKDNPYTHAAFLNRQSLAAEKAFNQEIGFALKGDFGVIETSFFQNHYKNLLARADKRIKGIGIVSDFYNTQNIKLNGINILGKIDWSGIFHPLPEGLYSNFAYNRVKIKNRELYSGFILTAEPTLEAVQPGRFIAGIGYDQPDGKWGFNLSGTYSKAKSNSELTGNRIYGGGNVIPIAGKRSRSWYTYDLIGYYTFKQKFTLRAGIYNLSNRKYSTWESVRQSSINAVNQDLGSNTRRYAAPGRNFSFSLEMKF